jgi:hypothetical protein
MKKQDQKRLDEALDKALAPPRQKPKQNLDALLDEYDDERSSSIAKNDPKGIPASIPTTIPEGIPSGIPESIPSRAARKKAPKDEEEPAVEALTSEQFTPLDATHTGSERSIYSIMYRETISKGISERHFGPAELMKKSGIRSRNTVHKALYGLQEKFSIEVIAETRGNPIGPRYRVYRPQDIERRRKDEGIKIDTQSKKIVERGGVPAGIPSGIPAAIPKNWDTTIPEIGIPTIPKIGIVYKRVNKSYVEPDTASPSSSISSAEADDERFALSELNKIFSEATLKITGSTPRSADRERWAELARVLVSELEIAAGHTTISSVPSFLAEHLRRRLWKIDKQQAQAEGRELPDQAINTLQSPDASQCPDCAGSGWHYPQGLDKGVKRCQHERLTTRQQSEDAAT